MHVVYVSFDVLETMIIAVFIVIHTVYQLRLCLVVFQILLLVGII